MRSVFFVGLSALYLTTVGAAAAHHSFAAEFDIGKPVKLTGRMRNIEWTNPHAWLYLDVENDSGGSDAWAVELVGANGLLRRGWTRESIGVGEVITIEGFAARDGSNTANASTVVIASTGERLYASSRDD